MTAIIQTEQLTKSYGSHRGIVDVDLTVEQGEVFGFLGPNGAGKTTTIRLLLDLIRPTSGRATVFGIETTVDPVAIHRRIGYLPGEFALYVLLAVGIEAFARRDLGASTSVRTPGLPAVTLGLRGPIGRAFGERLSVALAWGLGIGFFGLVMAAISRTLADEHPRGRRTCRDLPQRLPELRARDGRRRLRLMIQLMFIVAGFAAATLVSGWASDETSGRLKMLLTTPLARAQWAIRSGLGVFAAIALMTAIIALAVGIGAAIAGSDALTPMTGSITLGLYAAGLAGVGFAVGGLFRTTIAAEIVALVVIAMYLIDLLAPAMKLPDLVHQLALTAHLGQPMVGAWDFAGVAACLVLAAGGLALGGWGMRRRDVAR